MKYIFIISCVLWVGVLNAQLVTVKDSQFNEALCQKYPSVMKNNCTQLDTAAAEHIDFSLIITNSDISEATEISYFNRLDTLILSNNNLTSFLTHIQTSNFWSLHYLDLSNNQLEVFPILSLNVDYTLVKHIYFQNNKATTLQKYWSLRDSIIVLNVANNYIEDCQDYSMALKATEINLSNNYFTFQDLEPQTKHPNFTSVFTVAPQRKVKWLKPIETGIEYQTFSLTIPVDYTVKNNTYSWYFNGELVKTTTTNTLVFDSLKLENAGVYTVEITNSNPLLANLTLSSEEVELVVNECMAISTKPSALVNEKCNGARVVLLKDENCTGISPITINFTNGFKAYQGIVDDEFELPIGQYTVTATDSTGCLKSYKSPFYVNGYVGCDENIITPDGDGLQDEYYFDKEGIAKVYNRLGQLIREIELPGFWDAKTSDGKIVPPGKYILMINDSDKVELKIVW